MAALTAVASANLTGSTFQGNDGDQVAPAGFKDWQNAPNLHVGTDLNRSQNDNAFGQGTSENDTNVTVVLGSIPNSKADLGRFADSTEVLPNGDTMLYLAWVRNDTSGTVNFDFELNQKAQPNLSTAGPKTLIRTGDGVPGGIADDLLINYSLQGGSQSPTLNYRRWNSGTSSWSDPPTSFNAGIAEAGFNQTQQIANFLGGPATIPAAEFGEGAINMTAAGLILNQNDPNAPCQSFASAYVKSRASSSFSSEIKDEVAPVPFSNNTCGGIKVVKVTDPSPDTTNSTFNFTPSYESNFSLQNGGSNDTGQTLKAGSGYSVSETPKAGWDTTASCDHNSTIGNITVVAGQTTTCTFTNVARGKIIVKKLTDPATDTTTQFGYHTDYGSPFSLTNGGQNDSGLLVPGTYHVTEDPEPPGWGAGPLNVTCSDGSDPAVGIPLAPGEIVTCTYTNREQGKIIVHKAIKGPADTTTSFGFTSDYGSDFSINSTQSNDSGFLNTGTYHVSEKALANWKLVSKTCDDGSDPTVGIALSPGEVVNCTFTNELQVGSISIHKTHLNKAAGGVVPEANVPFVITGPGGSPVINATTDANGNICVDGLFFGAYTVHENVPQGEVVDHNDQVVNVDNVAYCGDGNGENVSFVNTPLTDVHVQAIGQFPGGTKSTIVCTDGVNTIANSGPAKDPTNADAVGLVPGTYTCTVVIDP
jgi:hypothetical protein